MLGWNSISLLVRIKETGLIPVLMGKGQMEQNLWLWLPEEIEGVCICLTFLPNFIFSKYRTFLGVEDNNSTRKQGAGQVHVAPKQGNRTQETFRNNSMHGKKRCHEREQKEGEGRNTAENKPDRYTSPQPLLTDEMREEHFSELQPAQVPSLLARCN